jgi:hypothetical protein
MVGVRKWAQSLLFCCIADNTSILEDPYLPTNGGHIIGETKVGTLLLTAALTSGNLDVVPNHVRVSFARAPFFYAHKVDYTKPFKFKSM